MELASIVVPIYKIEKYIRKCIESIQAQICENIEIILVDDGTPDRSGDICEEYAAVDHRIKVIHKVNGGLSDARNVGASHATGKYLFFVDGDDTVSPNLVEKTVRYAEELNADMVFFDFESVEEDTGRRDRYRFGLPEHQCIDIQKHPEILITSPSAWCRLYKREFWEQSGIRFPKGLHYEDLATTPRLILAAERIGYMGDEPLYNYLLRSGSIMTGNNFENSYIDRTYVLNYLKTYFTEQNTDETYAAELEYLFFDHAYFVPSKEIIRADTKSPWLGKFKLFALNAYPDMLKNPYITRLSWKDRILLCLMNYKLYGMMNLLSGLRKRKDSMKQDEERCNAESINNNHSVL